MCTQVVKGSTGARNRGLLGKRGQTAIILTIAFGTMLALLGLVFDGGRIYFEKRHMQAAADAGVFGAIQEMRRGNRNLANNLDPAARYDAGLNGYDAANSTVAVNSPPSTGPNSTNPNFVEVIITQTVPSTFMRVVSREQSTVRVRSVGGMVWGGDPCLVALNTTAQRAFNVNGNTTVEADCGVYSNSSASNALNSPSGTGCITATWAGISGQANGTCFNFSGGMDEGLPPIPDPLATLPEPDCSAMPAGRRTGINYWPGRYTGNLLRINGGTYRFQPGIYCVTSGIAWTGGNISGDDVMFYIVNNPGNMPNGVNINGNVNVDLHSPTSGPYTGILFYGARTNPNWNPGNQIEGSATSTFTGAIYFRNESISFAGNTDVANEWAMVVGDTVTFIGNSGLRFIKKPTDPTTAPPIFRVALVE